MKQWICQIHADLLGINDEGLLSHSVYYLLVICTNVTQVRLSSQNGTTPARAGSLVYYII